MCLGNLPVRYGAGLNRILYPSVYLELALALLSRDSIEPPILPTVKEAKVITNSYPTCLKYEFAVELNRKLAERFGGLYGVKDSCKLEYALELPRNTVFGELAYPTLELQAAHIAFSIAVGHPFHDGNKRTAWNLVVEFIAVNHCQILPDYPNGPDRAIRALVSHDWAAEDFARYLSQYTMSC